MKNFNSLSVYKITKKFGWVLYFTKWLIKKLLKVDKYFSIFDCLFDPYFNFWWIYSFSHLNDYFFLFKVGSNSSISNTFYWLDGSTVNPSFLYTGSTESDCNFASTEKCLYLNQAGYLDDCPCSAYRSIMCQF